VSTSASALVREAIDVRRLSWVRPLVSAYDHDFDSIASFFAGNPRIEDAWRQTIARVSRAPRHRDALARILDAQLEARGAPGEARRSASRLAEPTSVAVVTGQQAGLAGGPLYTLLKAVSAVRLARHVESTHGVVAVPVFWVADEDHDWAEVRSTALLDGEYVVRTIEAPETTGAGALPVSDVRFDERISSTVESLQAALPPTAFTAGLLADLRRWYRPGANLGVALAGLLDGWLGPHGLVVFSGSDPAAKPLVTNLFTAELRAPTDTAERVRAAGEALRERGHEPQLLPVDHATALFYLDGTGRRPIRFRDGKFGIGDAFRDQEGLCDEAASHPERFSPNVMLRPVVQDQLFPTVCYVAGPSELAYQAQLAEVYRAFGVERPLYCSRASATILDAATARFLDRYDLPFETLAARDVTTLNRLLARQLPEGIEDALTATERALTEHAGALKTGISALDPTLAGAVDTTRNRMADALATLRRKVIQAAKRKDETLRRQFTRARALTFPDGHPQERTLGVAMFINRYGPALVERLLDGLPVDGARHFLLEP
jgi:bacillithiol biosynthesis cysteine-adding enzyme BshC